MQKAIDAGHLDAVRRGRAYLIDPASVATYRERVPRRAPDAGKGVQGRAHSRDPDDRTERAPTEPALLVRIGNKPGGSFRLKAPELVKTSQRGNVIDGFVPMFRRAAICFSGKQSNRMFVLEPDDEVDEPREFEIGGFFVHGRFRIARKVNDPRRAAEDFRAFTAE